MSVWYAFLNALGIRMFEMDFMKNALLAVLLLTNVLDAPLTFLREGLLDFLTRGGSWAFNLTLRCLL